MTKKDFFKSSFVLLGAGLMGFASCTNEDESTNPSKDEKIAWTFEVGNGDVRTMLYPDKDNKVVFKKGDSISVFNNLEAGASTKAGGDKFVAGKAEDFGDGDTASVAMFNGYANIGAQHFAILYPYQADAAASGITAGSATVTATIPAEQTATPDSFDPKANLSVAMTEAEPSFVPKFYLKNAVGLLKFSVDKAYDKVVICGALGEKIAGKVTINAATAEITGRTNATDRIVMSDLVPGKVYYAAVIPQEYKSGISVKFYNGGTLDGHVRVLNPSQILEVKRSKILNVGIVKPEVPKMLTGKFSVAAGKQVIFSPGNLLAIWNGSTYDWGFEERQWDFVGDATRYGDSNGNTHIDGDGKNNLYAMVDLFRWTKADKYNDGRKQYGINASGNDADYGNSTSDRCCDWGKPVSNTTTTWYTPAAGDWSYLLNSRGDKAWAKATINSDATGVPGLLLFPDGFSWSNITWSGTSGAEPAYKVTGAAFNANTYTSVQFADMEKAGVVFLSGWEITFGVLYWSSTPAYDFNLAYDLLVFSGGVNLSNADKRRFGRSVRLVTKVN